MQDRAFYERIGAKFQSERERQKITREHMAEQINISSKFLYEIESGRKVSRVRYFGICVNICM